jgi:hypothetical protein
MNVIIPSFWKPIFRRIQGKPWEGQPFTLFFLCPFLLGHFNPRGDVEEVANLIEQHMLPFHFADVLAKRHHPIRMGVLAGLVLKLGHILEVEVQVEVFALVDNARPLVLLESLPHVSCQGFVVGLALQSAPTPLAQGRRMCAQRRRASHAKNEVRGLGPPVEMLRQRKVRIPTQADAWGN